MLAIFTVFTPLSLILWGCIHALLIFLLFMDVTIFVCLFLFLLSAPLPSRAATCIYFVQIVLCRMLSLRLDPMGVMAMYESLAIVVVFIYYEELKT